MTPLQWFVGGIVVGAVLFLIVVFALLACIASMQNRIDEQR